MLFIFVTFSSLFQLSLIKSADVRTTNNTFPMSYKIRCDAPSPHGKDGKTKCLECREIMSEDHKVTLPVNMPSCQTGETLNITKVTYSIMKEWHQYHDYCKKRSQFNITSCVPTNKPYKCDLNVTSFKEEDMCTHNVDFEASWIDNDTMNVPHMQFNKTKCQGLKCNISSTSINSCASRAVHIHYTCTAKDMPKGSITLILTVGLGVIVLVVILLVIVLCHVYYRNRNKKKPTNDLEMKDDDPDNLIKYRDYDNRLRSLRKWKKIPVEKEKVAAAGLYYNVDDKVTCPFCRVTIENWKKGDKPDVRHFLESLRCHFIIKYFKLETKRLETFKDWQDNFKVKPEELAKVGFVYIGPGDMVQCVYCQGKLSEWTAGDTAETEHRRCFPQCTALVTTRSCANSHSNPRLLNTDEGDGPANNLMISEPSEDNNENNVSDPLISKEAIVKPSTQDGQESLNSSGDPLIPKDNSSEAELPKSVLSTQEDVETC